MRQGLWGYSSTIVRILQGGGGIPWTGGLVGRPAPSFRGGLAWPAPPSRPLRPPTLLGTGGLALYPRRGLRPLHPAWREASLLHLGARGQRHPGGGRGDGTVAKRDLARSQRGLSPGKRGHGPTAVRPRCDGLFPAGTALRWLVHDPLLRLLDAKHVECKELVTWVNLTDCHR